MKKVLIVIIFIFAGVNIIVTTYSNEIFNSNLEEMKNIALADDESGDGFDCYSRLSHWIGYRTLECNTPCCYRNDYDGEEKGGKCTGHFSDCD
jgi:hypothetical protein